PYAGPTGDERYPPRYPYPYRDSYSKNSNWSGRLSRNTRRGYSSDTRSRSGHSAVASSGPSGRAASTPSLREYSANSSGPAPPVPRVPVGVLNTRLQLPPD